MGEEPQVAVLVDFSNNTSPRIHTDSLVFDVRFMSWRETQSSEGGCHHRVECIFIAADLCVHTPE